MLILVVFLRLILSIHNKKVVVALTDGTLNNCDAKCEPTCPRLSERALLSDFVSFRLRSQSNNVSAINPLEKTIARTMRSSFVVVVAAVLLVAFVVSSEAKPAGAAFSKELDKILSSLSPRSQQVIIDLINIDQGKMSPDERKRQMRTVMAKLDRTVLEELFQLYKTTQ
ncbi:hypothetical protein QR680_000940 [Steinernema hermaphroditum]|uniref:SXP/RAL-2 family protein Ani s 5-like cation-binding domain-containing protein n=1 Tax=Steinernema hermaphroditum TaxID=289476 RepID=A0AA39LEJ3_9BILA|nr:hypothetical protein QR680_000940 [Steinernema hermaphroditum]